MQRFGHVIGGRATEPASGRWLPSEDPAHGTPWAEVAQGCAADAAAAVADAARAFPGWAADGPARMRALHALADLLDAEWPTLVEAEVRDNGKRIAEVRGQFAGLGAWYRHFADAAASLGQTRLSPVMAGVEVEADWLPFGVIAAITPWNSPLMILAWKLAPALAAGNTVVVKPSELASASTVLFALLAARVLPAGVINVLCGLGAEAGAALVDDPRVRKVTFTGSDTGGRMVAAAAGRTLAPVVRELGGKSAQVVCAECDRKAALNGIAAGIFASNGQSCVAGSRLIVEESIAEDIIGALVALAHRLRPGDPMDPATQVAPLANRPHFDKVVAMIETARREGAHLIAGGRRLDVPGMPAGLFVAPTIFTNVTPAMEIWREEVFGPVLAVTTFRDEEDAVALANDTTYGLASAVWTGDSDRASRVAPRIMAGTVYVNHYRSVDPGVPLGGIGRSGFGRELGPEALHDFLQQRVIWRGTTPFPDPFPD
ncbi:MAG: aldehyde dehydrogenase family protein [Rhodobacteraceae bacterium]|nr:aldehyde dehydrogenase family protein [Paracoccaceae bacterium]